MQLPPAETVTEYVPGASEERSSVLAPLDQLYEYEPGEETVIFIAPLF